jgi:hypothetical protein
MKNLKQHIPQNLGLFLITAMLAAACTQLPETSSPAAEPQSEQPASAATEEFTAVAETTPTATPEADPRDQLGSSVWGAMVSWCSQLRRQTASIPGRCPIRK